MTPAIARRSAAFRHVFAAALLGWWMAVTGFASAQPSENVSLSVEVTVQGAGFDITNPLEVTKTFALRDNILALLSIEAARKEGGLRAAQIAQLHRQAPAQIRAALEPFGFYSPQIQASLTREAGRYVARYRIDPGPSTRVSAVNIAVEGPGRDDPQLAKLIREFPLKPGAVLHHPTYESGKTALLNGATNAGYLDAQWDASQVLVSRQERSAVIYLVLKSGDQFLFGKLTFTGEVLDETQLQRYADFAPGELYSPAKLLDLQTALFNTNYFASVEVYPRREEAVDRRVPVEVVVTPRERFRYSAGIGYSTDTGPRASLGREDRRVNPRGDRFNTIGRWSAVRTSIDLSYIIPWTEPRTDRVELSSGWSDRQLSTGWEEKYVLGLSRTRALGPKLVLTPYLTLSTEEYLLGSDSGRTQLLTPGTRLTHLESDSTQYPRRGHRLTFEVRGASERAFSDASFAQGSIAGKWVRGLWPDGRLLLRGDIATTYFAALEELPPSVRYFAGGDQSVRGYDYEALSTNGEGGKQLLVGSVEVEQRFLKSWSAALFFDAGNAMNDWGEPLAHGAGGGVRWLSPIGPVRLDIAWAISEPDNPYRFHITVGPDL